MSFNVLIIDDIQTNVNALAVLIEQCGGSSISARSPALAVEALHDTESVDIVFLDLEFPNHSGLEWVATLKKDKRISKCPFVAYTVHTSEENLAWKAGFHSFIGKPINVAKFPEYLEQILNGIQVWEVH